jgi:hypothetical protein
MSGRPHLACALALLAILGGCTALPAADPGGDSPDPGDGDGGADPGDGNRSDGENATDDGNGSSPESPGGADPGYESYVFDHAGAPAPAIESGIVYDAENATVTRRYVTLVTAQSEAERRFDRSVLDAEARAFVENTSFEDSYLVVFQAFPASSSPDYRVESVGRDEKTVHLRVTDSAPGGTADVTVETLLVRLPRGEAPPEHAVVTTEEGATVRSGEGVVSGAPGDEDPEAEDENETELPYRGPDAESNREDPLAVRVHNAGDEVNAFRVNITYVGGEEAALALDSGWQKLSAGQNWSVAEAVARAGAYRVRVAASLPGDDGDRRRVSTTATWNVTADESAPLRVRLTDENVTVTTESGSA